VSTGLLFSDTVFVCANNPTGVSLRLVMRRTVWNRSMTRSQDYIESTENPILLFNAEAPVVCTTKSLKSMITLLPNITTVCFPG